MRIAAHAHGYGPVLNAGAEHALHGLLAWLVARGHEARVWCPDRALPGVYDGVQVEVGGTQAEMVERYGWADVVITHLDLTRTAMGLATAVGRPLVHYVHNDKQLAVAGASLGTAALVVWCAKWLPARRPWPGRSVVCWPRVMAGGVVRASAALATAVTLVNCTKAKGAVVWHKCARALPGQSFLGVRGCYGHQLPPPPDVGNIEMWDPQVDMRRVYERTRVVLMPSVYESWGMVAMEACANGIPVIAAPTPGLRESLGGRVRGEGAGTFVGVHHTGHWVRELERLADPGEYAVAAARARARWVAYEAEVEEMLVATEAALLETVGWRAPSPGNAAFPGNAGGYVALQPCRLKGEWFPVGAHLPVSERRGNVLVRRGRAERV